MNWLVVCCDCNRPTLDTPGVTRGYGVGDPADGTGFAAGGVVDSDPLGVGELLGEGELAGLGERLGVRDGLGDRVGLGKDRVGLGVAE